MNSLRQRLGFFVAGGAVACVAGGIAVAAIPSANGVIHACYKTANGGLAVREENVACDPDTERPISWNAQGPAGPQGPPGPEGPPGASALDPPAPTAEELLIRRLTGTEQRRSRLPLSRPRGSGLPPRAVAVGPGGLRLLKARVGFDGLNMTPPGPDSASRVRFRYARSTRGIYRGLSDGAVVDVYFRAPVLGCVPVVSNTMRDGDVRIAALGDGVLPPEDNEPSARRMARVTVVTNALDGGSRGLQNEPFTLLLVCDPRDRPPPAVPAQTGG